MHYPLFHKSQTIVPGSPFQHFDFHKYLGVQTLFHHRIFFPIFLFLNTSSNHVGRQFLNKKFIRHLHCKHERTQMLMLKICVQSFEEVWIDQWCQIFQLKTPASNKFSFFCKSKRSEVSMKTSYKFSIIICFSLTGIFTILINMVVKNWWKRKPGTSYNKQLL